MPRYNPAPIEAKWQSYWDEHHTFATPRLPAGEKMYVLDMFPYPSGDGLHVGHPEGYTATDIVCRAARMQGKSVLHPMGFDSFGLPAEEHAIKTGEHPRVQTEQNISTFRRQMKMLGFSYDWSRELATTDVKYFRWTQWIFVRLFNSWYDRAADAGRPISELVTKLESGQYLVAPTGEPVVNPTHAINAFAGDPAGLPALGLAFGAAGLLTLPLANAFSRWRETLADDFALHTTHSPEAFASAMTRLANQNLAEAEPEHWVVVLLHSHPPLQDRIRKARRWAARQGTSH